MRPAEAINVYRQAAIKLINSLSRSSDVVRLEAIDPDQSILRINSTISAGPPPIGTRSSRSIPTAYSRTASSSACWKRHRHQAALRARRLARLHRRAPAALRCAAQIAEIFQALAREHSVDVEGDISRFIAKRAGFQNSGVSRNNRLIERHAGHIGYFWTSYDFSGAHPKAGLFQFPLGPGGEFGFQYDGGETIFSLPNGFQGYYLNTRKALRSPRGRLRSCRIPSART